MTENILAPPTNSILESIAGRPIGHRRISELRTRKDEAGNLRTVAIPHEGDLSFEAKQILTKVRVLRDYTKATGFRTTKSQNDLIQTLDGDDLASVLLILNTNAPVPTGRPFTAAAFTSVNEQ